MKTYFKFNDTHDRVQDIVNHRHVNLRLLVTLRISSPDREVTALHGRRTLYVVKPCQSIVLSER